MSERKISRRSFLKGMGAGAVAAAGFGMLSSIGSAANAAAPADMTAATYTPGTYTASAQGIGTVTMTATFDETSITAIELDVSGETATIGQAAKDELIEQIMAAQSADIDGVSGATVTSNAVKECLQDCIAQASVADPTAAAAMGAAADTASADWKTEPDPVDDSEIVATYDAEYGIVGYGHAGMTLTRVLGEGGATVVAIEAQDYDSWGVLGQDIGHINSKVLESFGVPKVDEQEFYNNLVVQTQGKANPKFLMDFTKYSGEAVDWYFDACDQRILDGSHVCFWPDNEHTVYTLNNGYHYYVGTLQLAENNNKDADHQVENPVQLIDAARCQRTAAEACDNVTLLFGTKGYYLLKNENGDVTGFIAQGPDGYVKVNCSKGVIISSGGFGMNQSMCRDLMPAYYTMTTEEDNLSCFMDRDGTGIQMGYWAGARMEAEIPTMNFDSTFGPTVWNALWLDKHGKRYQNEALAGQEITGFYMSRAKRGMSVALFDNTYEEQMMTGHPAHGWLDYSMQNTIDAKKAQFEEALAAGPEGLQGISMTGGAMYAADTLDELADDIGYTGQEKENFLRSVEHYNELCEAGVDTDFAKDPHFLFPVKEPPFYAVTGNMSQGICMVTMGGFITDNSYNVVDKDYEPIKGLYAAGNTCGLRWGPAYVTPIAGMSIGMAITLSYVLGKELLGEITPEV